MKSALLLVDLQADYLAAPGLEPPAALVVARAGELVRACRAAGVAVLHVHTEVRQDDDRRMPHWRAQGVWRCVAGTPGARAPEAVAPAAGEVVVSKTFYDGFASGELEAALRRAGCDHVIVAGVHEHACVRAAALGAYERGFAVTVAADAVASDDPLHASASRQWLEARAARHVPVAELVKLLSDRDAAPDGDGADRSPDVGHIDAVVAAARAAQPGWRATPVATRGAALERLAQALEARRSALAALIVASVKKPLSQALAEVDRAALLARVAATQAVADGDAEVPRGPTSSARWRAVGTVLAITPWNNPLALPVGKLAPALAYGDAVVLKPALLGLAVARTLMAALAGCGLPDGLVGLVAGGRAAGERLLGHAGIDAASVTGSRQTGLAAMALCGRRNIPLQAELGGNNGAIVWGDADLDQAARAIAVGAFAFAGQRCTANRRAIVERAALDAFLARADAAMQALAWGAARDPATVVGPMVSAEAAARAAEAVAAARAAGPRVLARAGAPAGDGPTFVAPTIVVVDDPSDVLVQHESFAPILVVQPADSFEAALALLNGVPQGLAAALFSPHRARRERFLAAAEAGILKLDQATSDADAVAPFGGWKASGLGPPEHGPHDRDFYARVQAVYRPEDPA
ncbi:MAG: aldehyde dehydrogenase family protein [Myxococcota bacterium]